MSTSLLDSGNIFRSVYEPSNETLRVSLIGSGSPAFPNVVELSDGTGFITSTVSGGSRALDVAITNIPEITISHLDDSIALGTSTALFTGTTVGPAFGLDVNIINASPWEVVEPDKTSSTVALNALNASVSLTMNGSAGAGFQILPGTFIGRLVAESSIDGGTNWAQVNFYDPTNSAVLSDLTFTSANTLKIVSLIPISGTSTVRVRVASYTSGSANGLLRAAEVSGAVGAITAAAFNTISNSYISIPSNTPTLLLSSNSNRKFAYFSNNSNSLVNIQFGSSTGLSPTTGLIIPSQGRYELQGGNLFTGNVYGYSASAITISVTEGTP